MLSVVMVTWPGKKGSLKTLTLSKRVLLTH